MAGLQNLLSLPELGQLYVSFNALKGNGLHGGILFLLWEQKTHLESYTNAKTIPVTGNSEQINRPIIASKSYEVGLDTTHAPS